MKAEILVAMHFRRPAESYYERVIKIDPQRATALLGLGRVRLELNLRSAAVRTAAGARARARRRLRELQHARSRAQGFGRCSRRVQRVEQRVRVLDEHRRGLVGRVRAAPAIPMCGARIPRRWRRRADGSIKRSRSIRRYTKAHFQLGVLADESNAYDAAIEHYRRAIETDPACLMALTNLAVLVCRARRRVRHARDGEARARARAGRRPPQRLLKLLEPFEKKPEEKP